MITNNLRNIIRDAMRKETLTNVRLINGNLASNTGKAQIGGGTVTKAFLFNHQPSALTSNSIYMITTYSLMFGGGDTAPTANDYCLEQPYNGLSGFDFKSITMVTSTGANTLTLVGTVTNLTGEDITIKELGVLGAMSESTALTTAVILLARKVIDPVTIAPNETKTFQYTLNFSELVS